MTLETDSVPTLDEIRDARRRVGDLIVTTPTWNWRGREAESAFGDTQVFLKLELFQYAGTFKPRGALLNMLEMDDDARQRGVTAVSAGNHAMAVGYAAKALGMQAKVVMPKTASPVRIQGCEAYGAEVVLVDDVHQAFDEVKRIEREEGRTFIHPFEGRNVALGTGMVGLELAEQVPDLDAVIIPVGGGGLAAGISTALRAAQPDCELFGVEPEGADSMHRSFAAGSPQAIERVRTIADSLGAPHAAPYSFELCRRNLSGLVKVDDDALRAAMGLLFTGMKLAVEPAAAAATAALCGPLAERLRGRRVGLVVCGTNYDLASFAANARPGTTSPLT